MTQKVTLEEIEAALLENKVEQPKIVAVLHHLNQVIQEEQKDKAKTSLPKTKKEFVVIIPDSTGELKGKDLVAYVLQDDANQDSGTIISRLKTAIDTQNSAAKRKKTMISTLMEACSGLKRKFSKQNFFHIKTKEAVRVVIVSNEDYKLN